eukprot:4412844-Pyramimonas_sp.AAC.1
MEEGAIHQSACVGDCTAEPPGRRPARAEGLPGMGSATALRLMTSLARRPRKDQSCPGRLTRHAMVPRFKG